MWSPARRAARLRLLDRRLSPGLRRVAPRVQAAAVYPWPGGSTWCTARQHRRQRRALARHAHSSCEAGHASGPGARLACCASSKGRDRARSLQLMPVSSRKPGEKGDSSVVCGAIAAIPPPPCRIPSRRAVGLPARSAGGPRVERPGSHRPATTPPPPRLSPPPKTPAIAPFRPCCTGACAPCIPTKSSR